jgi:hypothetical protein
MEARAGVTNEIAKRMEAATNNAMSEWTERTSVLIDVAPVENMALGFQRETFGGRRFLRATRRHVQ